MLSGVTYGPPQARLMRIRRDAAITCVLVVLGCVLVVVWRLISILGCVLVVFLGVRVFYFDECSVFVGGVPIGHILKFNFGVP